MTSNKSIFLSCALNPRAPSPTFPPRSLKAELRKEGGLIHTEECVTGKASSGSSQGAKHFILLFIYLFIYFWGGCVWSSLLRSGFSLVAASGGSSLLQCAGFSLRWLLLLWSTGSRCAGFSSCGSPGSVVVARRLSSCGSRA